MNPVYVVYIVLSVWMGLFSFLDKTNIVAYAVILGLSIIILEPIRKRIAHENKEYQKFREDMRRK